MSHLILVRHGQSEWNLQKRFTGWVDVDLAPNGKLEACKSGELIKEKNIKIDYFFTSLQLRAINTLKLILNTMKIKDTYEKAWELNERHYGALTGLNKEEMKKNSPELGDVNKLKVIQSMDSLLKYKQEMNVLRYNIHKNMSDDYGYDF